MESNNLIAFFKRFSKEITMAVVLSVVCAVLFESYKGWEHRHMLEENSKAIATIYVLDENGKKIAQGSGLFIDSSGTLVTNYHVIAAKGGKGIEAELPTGAYYRLKDFKDWSPTLDIAILQFDAKDTPKIELGDSEKIKIGDYVFTVGNPLGLEGTISEGVISCVKRIIGGNELIQFTAPISPGNSGGGLFNNTGKVIGITSSSYHDNESLAQNLNFAVPVNRIKKLINEGEANIKNELSPEYYYSLGVICENHEQFDKAIEYFNKAISVDSNYIDAYIDLSFMYFKKHDFDAEVKILKYAETLAPGNQELLGELATAYEDLGLYDDAIACYEKHLRARPKDQEDMYSLAILYMAKGEYEKARNMINMFSLIDPGQAKSLKSIYNRLQH